MALVNIQTDLKSLKYGRDRLNGGSSNEPYIRKDIPVGDIPFSGGTDFMLRAGINTPLRAADDVSRITQMFFDLKSPTGFLFNLKQNLLSRSNVQTQGGSNILGFNNGGYLPTSTILQAGGVAFGSHLNKQGLDPTKPTNAPTEDSNQILTGDLFSFLNINDPLSLPLYIEGVKIDQPTDSNRLVKYFEETILNPSNTVLTRYPGGPGSIVGIGETVIPLQPLRDRTTWVNPSDTSLTLNATQLSEKNVRTGKTQDFRKELIGDDMEESSFITNFTGYSKYNKTVHGRIFAGDPGRSNTSVNSKDILHYGVKASDMEMLDRITGMELYSGTPKQAGSGSNDLAKFRISTIDNSGNADNNVNIHFRAFIDSFTDSHQAEWNANKFPGRGEELYNYGGYKRQVNLSFTVVAQSKPELIPMYKKLNYLASTLAPDYTEAGFMRGNLVRLTLGGYFDNQPGVITSLEYSIPEETTWEIAINEEGEADESVKELPHMIKVTGFNFIPIHEFLPRKSKLESMKNTRFIALGSEGNNNYKEE